MSHGFSGGKQMMKLPIQEIAFEFVYVIKTRQLPYSVAKVHFDFRQHFRAVL